jgi:hypothetical protein
MLPQRTPLGAISGDHIPNKHLSPYEHGKIASYKLGGTTPIQITLGLNLPRTIIQNTLYQDLLRDQSKTLPKAPRNKSYTDTDERFFFRHVRLYPKDIYVAVKHTCNFWYSTITIKRILKQHDITNWRAKHRPFLIEKHAAQRLAWCLRNRYLSREEWGIYI